MKYFKPKSLTWWASFVPLMVGLIVASYPLHNLTGVVDTLNNMTGDIHPAVLINAGLFGIGFRGALGNGA